MKRNIFIIFLLFILLLIPSCSLDDGGENVPDEETPIEDNKTETETKEIKPYQDFIYVKVIDKSNTLKDENNQALSTIKVSVLANYNDIFEESTDNSSYISEKMKDNDDLEIVISDVYYGYINVDDEFIYQLKTKIKVFDNDEEKVIIDARSNDYTMLPVIDGRLYFFNITSQINKATEPNYAMYEKMVLRVWYYGFRIDEYFMEYDSIKNTRDLKYYIINDLDKLSHFELVLKALSKIDSENFYQLKYSERAESGRGVKYIIEYLEDITMEVQDENN